MVYTRHLKCRSQKDCGFKSRPGLLIEVRWNDSKNGRSVFIRPGLVADAPAALDGEGTADDALDEHEDVVERHARAPADVHRSGVGR